MVVAISVVVGQAVVGNLQHKGNIMDRVQILQVGTGVDIQYLNKWYCSNKSGSEQLFLQKNGSWGRGKFYFDSKPEIQRLLDYHHPSAIVNQDSDFESSKDDDDNSSSFGSVFGSGSSDDSSDSSSSDDSSDYSGGGDFGGGGAGGDW